MAARHDPTPVPGPDAFLGRSRDAYLSQAAIVLSVGAAAAGEPERVDSPAEVGLPSDLAPLGRPEPIPVEEAVAPLNVDLSDHLAGAAVRCHRPRASTSWPA